MLKWFLFNFFRILNKLYKKFEKEHFTQFIDSKNIKQFKLGRGTTWIIHQERKLFKIGHRVDLRNYLNFVVGKSACLTIEDGVFMNNNCSINCLDSITIGSKTLFGEGVKIYDHNHQYTLESQINISHKEFNTAPVYIGSNCWLGSNVIVLKGVTIGSNSIIGVGCIITKDIPANSIVINQQQVIVKK